MLPFVYELAAHTIMNEPEQAVDLKLVTSNHHTTTTVLWPFFWDHPGEPVPEENFWTLWCRED